MAPPALLSTTRRLVRQIHARLTLGGAVLQGPARPAVALTFDDGPSREHTPRILDTLGEHGARATFFFLGEHVLAQPEIARRAAAEQEIGCHSHSHSRDVVRDLDTFRADVSSCKKAFSCELGIVPRYFRFPWGECGRVSPRDVMELEGMTCVHWSVASGDDAGDAASIVRNVGRGIEPGAIVLFHDGAARGSVHARDGRATVEALPLVLRLIAARGYRAVSVGELLSSG